MDAESKPRVVGDDAVSTLLKHLDVRADAWGNVFLVHRKTGSQLVFTAQGDIQVRAARDHDVKTGRWCHINSDQAELEAEYGHLLPKNPPDPTC